VSLNLIEFEHGPKNAKATSASARSLLDELFEPKPKGVHMNSNILSYRRILRNMKQVLGLILLILKILKELL